MRLWSLHPRYLDTKWLLAVWREGLLAKHVLEGKTKGYKNHPQLIRFKATTNPIHAINQYLYEILLEAKKRGYRFDESKVISDFPPQKIPVTTGQIVYESKHLQKKLLIRNPEKAKALPEKPDLHPMFHEIPGDIESWEKI